MLTPDLERIPPELKARPQWVAYRPDKTPVNPKTGKPAKANDPETWGTLDQALKYYEAHKDNGIAGIGYEFSYYDPYTGLDWDKCRDPKSGQLKFCAQVLIDYLSSYGEVSPSKTGIHILLKGKILPGEGNQRNPNCGGKIEVYNVDRYFTVTGHHLEGTPATIQDRDKELKAFHAQVIAKSKAPQAHVGGPSPTLNLADSEIIAKASAANGEKFDRLMKGDWSDYKSRSEADAALLFYLAYWTRKDAARMARLFRQSGLMRAKFDRPQSGGTWGALEIQKVIDKTTETYQGPRRDRGNGNRAAAKAALRVVAEAPAQAPTQNQIEIPTWPQEVMTGAAGKFARTYTNYIETPESFLFMAYLTFLGHVISDKITLDSEIAAQPRLFTIFLGKSAEARKSTSISKPSAFYQEVVAPDDLNTVWGVGSAEGLAKCFKKNKRAILILDELKSLIQKMRIDASVLLPCINTLFESNCFHSFTKKHDIIIDDAELCLLAASTLETYRNLFNATFLDIGFLNRLFIIIGDSERKFPIPGRVPQAERESLKSDLREVLTFVGGLSQDSCYAMPMNSTARDIFDEWYFGQEKTVFTRRLDTYGHRLMPLLAVNELLDIVTPEIAEKTVTLLNYQLVARKFADPIDADNAIARLEERIRRLLAGGPLPKRELERRGNKARVGIWAWDQAIKNLRKASEIFWDHKLKEFRLNA